MSYVLVQKGVNSYVVPEALYFLVKENTKSSKKKKNHLLFTLTHLVVMKQKFETLRKTKTN